MTDCGFAEKAGFMLASPKSGSGKTMLTCAFLQALKDRGINVQAFKCGPDYIDPMFHRQIIGVYSKNLDPFFSSPDQLRLLYGEHAGERDIAVLEGVMGLYDGLGGVSEEASSYQVAAALHLPVVLIADAHGMGRSVIPLLEGFLRHDTENLICGVILNRISGGFYETIAPVIERELSLPVIGYFPDDPALHTQSRHLGLRLPDEIAGLKGQTERAASVLEECVQADRLLDIVNVFCGNGARQETYIKKEESSPGERAEQEKPIGSRKPSGDLRTEEKKVRVAVARDEAFCFYYDDNLRLLKRLGAELVYFSPLHDDELPEDIDGLLIGGGYPELHAQQLESNESMRCSVREALGADMPSLAECGGYMYLHDRLILRDGSAYRMCGILPGTCRDTGRSVRFGYVSVSEKTPLFLENGQPVRGHEFHYFDSTLNGSGCIASKPVSGRSWECVHVTERHWWGFPHLYYPSNEMFALHFLEETKKFHREKACSEKLL